MIGAAVRARKQRIFPVERDRADGAFDGVVDAAIIDEARQRERITDGVGKLALLDGAP
jgi:hypothetical protein